MEFYLINYQQIILSCVCLFVTTFTLTHLVRFLAIHKNILDIPNKRSSHQMPMPRGGGIAIVLTFVVALIWFAIVGVFPWNLTIALLGGGTLIAIIGHIDDVYRLRASLRMIAHFVAASWAVYWIGGLTILDLGTWKFILATQGTFLAIIGIVWCINLYNFMDGIDGLAGSEGMFIAIASGYALYASYHANLALLMWLFAAMIAGFTVVNWPPAKIFLGDVGSGFIGYVFSVMAIFTANQALLPINFWLILLAIFLCDATFTLINRARRGEVLHAAHREHAYQQLVIYGMSHKQVTLGVLLVNVCILLPLAYSSLHWPMHSFWMMSFVILGLLIAWAIIQFNIRSLNQNPASEQGMS